MPEKPGSRFTGLFSRVFQFHSWLDVTRIKSFHQYIVESFRKLFVLRPQQAEESFDEAKVRLKLTDAMILKRQVALFRVSVLMITLASLLFFYGVYQFFYGSILGVFLTLILIVVALTLAFRYHFWYFQMKTKQLGCAWKTWLKEGLLGGEKE
ncbi:MAG: type IVB secretion system protein IcmV [Legionella sp.]|nr:type IVB secretion system protein IcmV [Legionella sp.]